MSQSQTGPLPALHLVGGFLGAGKTTAIIQASKLLMARGLRVGVVTNDQGKYLVDTAFVRLADLPAVEVTGGCFCCNYDDLNGRLRELLAAAHPQVVFAELVGSCADIVATVVKPLLELGDSGVKPDSFSVFADGRLLLRRLLDEEMPFSEDVVYIFDQQIAEAGLVVVNKADLLSQEGQDAIAARLQSRYPGKPYLFQSSLTAEGVWGWLGKLQAGEAAAPHELLVMDYQRYAAGEAQLAWLDQNVALAVPEGEGRAVLVRAIERLAAGIRARGAGIGHMKFIIQAEGESVKLSITALEEPDWAERIPALAGRWLGLLVNARVELPAEELRGLLTAALDQPGVQADLGPGEAFHPKEPKPTHRM